MPDFDDTVEFTVKVIRTSELALLAQIDGDPDEEYWFPFSQIDDLSDITKNSDVGDEGTLVVSEWIATEKGLV